MLFQSISSGGLTSQLVAAIVLLGENSFLLFEKFVSLKCEHSLRFFSGQKIGEIVV